MIRRNAVPRPRLALATTIAVAFVLALLLLPAVAGAADDQRGRRDAARDAKPALVLTTGDRGTEHPGHSPCPDGYRYELLLKEESDGSLWWSYGCVLDDPGL